MLSIIINFGVGIVAGLVANYLSKKLFKQQSDVGS